MPSDLAAVVLVHGATLNGRSWDPVRRLVDPRFRVLAPDLPGHGARRKTACVMAIATLSRP